jgi:hypothetical protein
MGKDELFVIEMALKVITRAMDELVGACLDESGKPKAPDMRALMKARGYLPPKCANAFPAKTGSGT